MECCSVVAISADSIRVDYDGWPSYCNVKFKWDDNRVAPIDTFTSVFKCLAKWRNYPWWPAFVCVFCEIFYGAVC